MQWLFLVAWADGRGGDRQRQKDSYCGVRRTHDLLMDGGPPAGDRWNPDNDGRRPACARDDAPP